MRIKRHRLAGLLIAGGLSGCGLVYDTRDLRDGQTGGGAAGEAGASSTGLSSSISTSSGAEGGGGAAACPCEPLAGMIWVVEATGTLPTAAPLGCPAGSTVLASGAVPGTLFDETSVCGGVCTGPSRVKVGIDDGCGVSGEGVPNDNSCSAKTLVPETGTSLVINLEPVPCTLMSPPLLDSGSMTAVAACQPDGDGCSGPPGARRCLPDDGTGCNDPCFPLSVAVAEVVDERMCTGVSATCGPPVFGQLELHDDAACAGAPVGSWSVMNAPICPAMPGAPASPTTSYWRYQPTNQPCDASAQPTGQASTGATLLGLCCTEPET